MTWHVQTNERAKECRVAVTSVAAYKERRAEEMRSKLDSSDEGLPVSRHLLASTA